MSAHRRVQSERDQHEEEEDRPAGRPRHRCKGLRVDYEDEAGSLKTSGFDTSRFWLSDFPDFRVPIRL